MKSRVEISVEDAQALLTRIAQRDESALRALHDQYAGRIFRFANYRLRDDDLAQTVMVDTLFEIWNKPQGFRGESQFSTWVLGIARHRALTELRKQRRRLRDQTVNDCVESLTDPNMNVALSFEMKETGQMLQHCIQRLARLQREVFELVVIDGMPMVEIAARQRVPEATIRTRLFNARRNLRHFIQTRQQLG